MKEKNNQDVNLVQDEQNNEKNAINTQNIKENSQINQTTPGIKIFQLTIVIILLISAFFAGKLSMKDDFYELYNRIDQLELQINQMDEYR